MFRILCVAIWLAIGDGSNAVIQLTNSLLKEVSPSQTWLNKANDFGEVRPTGRIIGGENAVIEAYPYQVSILMTTTKLHFCGGSIISPEYIVTAAHCVAPIDSPKKVKVRSGTSWASRGGAVHSVKEILIHEEYHSRPDETPLHDLALLKLEQPLQLNKRRQSIKMFKMNETIYKGSWGEVTGWGLTKKTKYRGQLQSVSIPVIPRDLCDAIYSSYPGQGTPAIPDGQICSGFYQIGGKDSCTGDSGGPLVVMGRLAGVVSWGVGCGNAKWPGVYTEIAYYRDWIANKTGI